MLEMFHVQSSIILAVIVGLIRSGLGWLDQSLKDGEISTYEWTLLAHTIVKYLALILILSTGMSNGQAVAAALGLEYFGDKIKKSGSG